MAISPSKQQDPGTCVSAGVATERRALKTSAARLSMTSSFALVLLKLVVGFWGGSVSVLSEAVHSATDLLASGIAFLSVRASDTPPDDEHPYGHGKIESISGLTEALLIVVAGAFIIFEAARKLMERPLHSPEVGAGLAVMGLSAVVNFFLSRRLREIALKTDSQALYADAKHLWTDVLTSLGVFTGLALARWTGKAWVDPLTALLVALFILRTAYQLFHEALMPLMDARLPPDEEAAIQDVLELDARVLGYHKLRTRKSGSHRHADVHVQIDDNCTLVQAHDLTEELEDHIRNVLPLIFINIHIEPYHAEIRHQQEVHGLELSPGQSAKAKQLVSPSGSEASCGTGKHGGTC